MGAKKKPMYRIVAADSRSPRDGAFLEIIGTYNPHSATSQISVQKDSLQKWLNNGAQATDTVKSLLKAGKLWPEANLA
jgi:small subunit ribosomal protein S16